MSTSRAVEVAPRDPQGEASARLGDGWVGSVLEPSPPAVADAPWFADDPAAPPSETLGRRTVTPARGGDTTWADLVRAGTVPAAWAAERWLAAWQALGPLPDGWAGGRVEVQRVAVHVVARARFAATGKFGLRYTRGGVGTPFFGADEQLRIEAEGLVRQRGGEAYRHPWTTLADLAAFAGVPVDEPFEAGRDTPPMGQPDQTVAVRPEVVSALGDWYGLAYAVLEGFRAEHVGGAPSRVQIWPEHFDAGLDLEYAPERRVNLGFSPGDADHPEPYAYLGPWGDERPGDRGYWNVPFGALLPHAELRAAADPLSVASGWLRRGLDQLAAG